MKGLITILLAGFATTAVADFNSSNTERVRVQTVTEITKPYTTKIKTGEQCYNDTIEVNVRCGNVDNNSIGVDTLIGGVIGGAIGNQIGKGNGREAARVVGGLLGAVTANNMRPGENICKTFETVRTCNPTYTYQTSDKIVGYRNCATIDGVEYCKQTSKPIKFLRVKRTIQVW